MVVVGSPIHHGIGKSLHEIGSDHRRGSFSAIFFGIFTYSEYRVKKASVGKPEGLAQFRVYGNQEMDSSALGVRPGNILVAVRDPRVSIICAKFSDAPTPASRTS